MSGGRKSTEWSDLSESQKTAVHFRGGPLLIIAVPGSGKTEVLACRVAYLIRAGIAKPESIIRSSIFPIEIGSPRMMMKNPFKHLRPFESFDRDAKKKLNLVTFEEIFSTLKSKLIEEKERGMPSGIDWQ